MTLFNNQISIITTQGAFIDGIWQEAFSVPSIIEGTVQVMSGEDFARLPEGRKQAGVVKVYTNAELKAFDQNSSSAGDIVLFGGRKWEIFARLPYPNGLIDHNKYLAALVVETPNA